MSDECTCEKCQAGPVGEQESNVRKFARTEKKAEGGRRPESKLYLVVTDGGISLRQQSYDM